MRDFEDIAYDLSNLVANDYCWPPEFPLERKTALINIDALLLEKLSEFLISRTPNEAKNRVVRRTLWFRGQLFLLSTLNCTTNFHSKASQLCVELAHKIATPGEAICQILLPSIETVEGSSMLDVKEATEFEENIFDPRNFLMHSNGTALIDATQIFQSTITDPDYFFSRESKKLHLTAEDRARLHRAVSEGGEICFNTLETMYRRKHNKAGYSLGDALQELNAALHEASVQNTGTEFEACLLEYREPILKFYRLYKSLTDTGKLPLQLCKITVNSKCVSLEKILLLIFAHASSSITQIVLTDAQMSDASSIGSVYPCPCLNQWSQDINTIINLYMQPLFESYLPGMAPRLISEPLPTTAELDELSRRYKLAFLERPVIAGINDQTAITSQPFVKIFITHTFKPPGNREEMMDMANCIMNIDDLMLVLALVPQDNWEKLFYQLGRSPSRSSRSLLQENNRHIAQVLQSLPTAQWGALFNAIAQSGYVCVCNFSELHTLFDNLPQPLWPVAVQAAESLFKTLFQFRANIIYFFRTYASQLSRYYPLFQSLIDPQLQEKDLSTLSMMIDEVHHIQWSDICIVLEPLLITLSKDSDFFNMLARSIRGTRCAAFVGFLLSVLPDDRLTIPRLVELLAIIVPSDYGTLFHHIGSSRLTSLFQNIDDLISFLNEIPNEFKRGTTIESLSSSLIQLKILPYHLQLLRQSFPAYSNELRSAFAIHHPRLIYQLYVAISTMQGFETPISSEYKTFARYLLEGMAHLTHTDQLKRFCSEWPLRSESEFAHFSDILKTLSNDVEQARSDTTLSDFEISSKTLRLIEEFMKSCQSNPDDTDQRTWVLYLQLKAIFTSDFYKAMENLTEWCKDDAPSYSAIGGSTQTPTSQASGPGLFSPSRNPRASNDGTARSTSHDSDEELDRILHGNHSP